MKIKKYELVFWDFDGVIKESVSIKSLAFQELFETFGNNLTERIKSHDLENPGISRFKKIPLYFKWSGQNPTDEKIIENLTKFNQIVQDKVINAPWTKGVEKFIFENHKKHKFIIISATPQDELVEICLALGLDKYFYGFFGSPALKEDLIKKCIDSYGVSPKKCLMIGDGMADYAASKKNKIDFILRRHKLNQDLEIDKNILEIKNFC